MKAGETQQAAENNGERGQKSIAGGEIRGKSEEGGVEAEGKEREAMDSACRLSGGMLCTTGGGPRISHPLPRLRQPTDCTNAGRKEVASARASGSGDMHLNGGKSLFAFSRRIC